MPTCPTGWEACATSRSKKRGTESDPRSLRSRKNVSFGPGQQQVRVGQRAIAAPPDKQTHPQRWLQCAGHNCVSVCFLSYRAGYRVCYSKHLLFLLVLYLVDDYG